jgi:hypothetical protein
MHFATRVRTWLVGRLSASKLLYSEIALSQKPFGIGHMHTYNFLSRMTDTMISHNIDLSSWDILCKNGSDGTEVLFGFAVYKRNVTSNRLFNQVLFPESLNFRAYIISEILISK